MSVRTRPAEQSAPEQDQRAASRRTAKRRAISVLGAFVFVTSVLLIAVVLALPLILARTRPAGVYSTSTSLVDAAPAAVEPTSGVTSTSDGTTANDHQAEVVAQDAAPPELPAASPPAAAAIAVAAPAPQSPPGAATDQSAADVAAAVAGAAVGTTGGGSKGTITIETFGFDFGDPPPGCKFVADVRNIDVPGLLQSETGLMPSVIYRVLAVPAAQAWLNTFAIDRKRHV